LEGLTERHALLPKPLVELGAVLFCEPAKTQVRPDSGAMIFSCPTPPIVFLEDVDRKTELAG